jgi:hypothetical protein
MAIEEKAPKKDFVLQRVQLAFQAPPVGHSEPITTQPGGAKKPETEKGNFQWISYFILFTDKNPDLNKQEWYKYGFKLDAMGTRKGQARELTFVDKNTKKSIDEPVDITPEMVEEKFGLKSEKLFISEDKVNLNPGGLAENSLIYENIHPRDKKFYTQLEFVKKFKDTPANPEEPDFPYYLLPAKSGEGDFNVFGEKVGGKEIIKGSYMEEENKYRSAVRAAKESAMSGGFDIMQKLYKKQHKKQKIRKK